MLVRVCLQAVYLCIARNCVQHISFSALSATSHIVALQVWEQDFAWTESEQPLKVAARALTLPEGHKLHTQPLFCFETMMHLLYWSCLVYDFKRVSTYLINSTACI